MAFYEYSIAPGHDNAAGFINVETMIDASDRTFRAVVGHPAYDPGSPRTLSNGRSSFEGFAATTWNSGLVRWSGYLYLYTTILGGAYDGEVSMRTRTKGGAYTNYNAILRIPTEVELENVNKGQAHPRFIWTFTRMVAI